MITINNATATYIYDLLIKEAGASESQRAEFMALAADQMYRLTEFRFQGTLGFGGKFYNTSGKWYIGCYREDQTPERLAVIEMVNKELEIIRLSAIFNAKTDAELQTELDAIDPADCPPLSTDRLDEIVRYATDPVYRALHNRCYAAEQELRNLKSLAWLAYAAWKESKRDCRYRMSRLAEVFKPKDKTEESPKSDTPP